MLEAARRDRGLLYATAFLRALTTSAVGVTLGVCLARSGLDTSALLSYFFFTRFHASELAISVPFFGARVMNAVSHLGAAWLARGIGLVNTMSSTTCCCIERFGE